MFKDCLKGDFQKFQGFFEFKKAFKEVLTVFY